MRRWYDISNDPISPEVMQNRRENLLKARLGSLFPNRINYFCDLAKGKDVLDVGVVEHTRSAVLSSDWLHKNLSQVAKTCLGVDILEDEVEYLRSLGFNIICADITKAELGQTFDLIVCGEVLEHVDAPGVFLASMAGLLRPTGRIIVSVPNPWYINVLLKTILNGSPYIDNADHVAWFDPCAICELGERCGLVLDRFTGIAVNVRLNWRTRFLFGISPLLMRLGLRPEIFAKAMVYEFVLAE
jgi:2-polyprenyl-3-methyl-5-hydroxy-6-metoxy-1,4-benzoquinol methylase